MRILPLGEAVQAANPLRRTSPASRHHPNPGDVTGGFNAGVDDPVRAEVIPPTEPLTDPEPQRSDRHI